VISAALKAVVEMQDVQLRLLEAIEGGVEQLLLADFLAGQHHLDSAALVGRSKEMIAHDLLLARDLFVRAIGQAHHPSGQALARINVAMCAELLDDHILAEHEATLALDLIVRTVEQLDKMDGEARRTSDLFQEDMLRFRPFGIGATEAKSRWIRSVLQEGHLKRAAEAARAARDAIQSISEDMLRSNHQRS